MSLPSNFCGPGLHASGIYEIRCASSGKVYVGSAMDLFYRWRGHYHHLNKGTHHCLHLQRAWRKYGPESFLFSVIEFCPANRLRIKEQECLDSVPSDRRYNIAPTAGSLLGFKQPASAIEKLRARMLGFRHSEETKLRISEIKKGRSSRPPGWKMTDEQKRQISAARKGRLVSHEVRQAISATLSGRRRPPRSAAWIEKIARSQRSLSDEQITEVKRRYLAGGSMTAIAADIGVSRKVVERAIRGKYVSDHSAPVAEVIKRASPNKGKPGKPWTDEQRQEASRSRRGRRLTPEQCEKIRAKKLEYWASQTPEHRAAVATRLRNAIAARKASQILSA